MKLFRSKENKFVFIFFVLTTLFHCIYAMQDMVIRIYPDELSYLDPARSFMRSGIFAIHNINENWEPILYSILLAPFTLIKNSYIQVKVLYIVNCIMMCSSIFPCFILAKKIITNKMYRLFAVVFIALIPEFFMTGYFMAENLFFPLSLWLFVAIYKYLEEEDTKKKRLAIIGLAILCFLLYATKLVALGYCIGIVAALTYDFIFENRNNFKENFINILIFSITVLLLIVFFKYYIESTADVLGTLYESRGELPLRNLKEILFLFFCIISYIVYTLIGFFFFPIVIPGAKFNSLKSLDRKLYVFSITALFSICCAVALICNIREDALEKSIRIHMRYYIPLIIPFILLMLSFSEVRFSRLQRKIYGIISGASIILMIVALRTPKLGCALDSWMLYSFKTVLYGICNKFQVDPTTGWPVILTAFIIIATILIFVFWGIKNGYNTKKITIAILILMVLENLFAGIIEYKHNKLYQTGIADSALINSYFYNLEGSILVVCNDTQGGYSSDKALDTYLSKEHFTVGYTDLNTLLDKGNGVWDISKTRIKSYYPWHDYYNLKQIDYIILGSECKFNPDMSNLKPIYIDGVEKFNIYLNLDPSYIRKNIAKLDMENITIDFSNSGNSENYIVSGWHNQEEEARWSSQEATLQYYASINSDYEIEILGGTLKETPEIKFYVDGIEVQSNHVTRTDTGYKLYIDEYGYNPDVLKHTISFKDLSAVSPSQLWEENKDERILSIFVKEIIVSDK